MSEIQDIPSSIIIPGDNDRTVFDQTGLEELAASIQEHGLAQPITVRDRPDGTFQIVAGERRFRAMSQVLKWETIPCIVRYGMVDSEASAIMLAENIGRKDLDPVDEALAYKKRVDQYGWEPAEIARRCGVSADRVKKRLKLVNVRQDILHLVRSGNFPVGHAEALSILDHNRQMIAARPLIDGQQINRRQFQAIVEQLYNQQCSESLFDLALWNQDAANAEPFIITHKVKIPIARDLPILRTNAGKHTGEVIYCYIRDLLDAGLTREAEICGALLVGLENANFVRLPVEVKNLA
jgi:ParB/RepB/Spo0J family partition protein